MAGSPVRSTRRADRLRRNPFVVIVVGFLVLFGGVEGSAAALINGLGGGPWIVLLTAVVVAPLAVVVYWGLITRFLEGRPFAPEIAFDARMPRLLLAGFALAILVMLVAYGVIALLGGVTISAGDPWLTAIAASLGLAVIAGVVEELFLRGVLFRVTEQYVGTWLALVVSALFFGFLHLANPDASLWAAIAIALEAGVSLAAIYVLTRSLWAAIGMHIGWNLSESLLGVPVSGTEPTGVIATKFDGSDWLTGGAFGMEASVVVVCLWLIVAAVLLVMARSRGLLVAPRWRSTASA
jgi:membrane protease YdiL (CAAX protease family)